MSDASARASCSGCGKTYAVPDATRTYTCKACGGVVAVPMDTRDAATEGEERRAASAELQQALEAVSRVRIFFGLGAVAFAVLTVMLVLRIPEQVHGTGEVLAWTAVCTALLCVNVVGFRQVRSQPYLWALVIAILMSLAVLLGLIQNPRPSLGLAIRLSWTALLWAQLPSTARARRLIAEHPQLFAAHRLAGTQRRRGRGKEAAEHALGQFEAARRSAARGSMAWSAGIVLIVAAAVAFALRRGGPALHERLGTFLSAWASADADAVARLAPAQEAEARRSLLERQVEAHGWGSAWPALVEPEILLGDAQATCAWQVEGGALHTTWEFEQGAWRLAGLRLPIPPLDGALERIVAAWNARDVAALSALYPPDKRDSAAKSIARVVERRAWGESWPELLEARAVPSGEAGANLTFRVAGDELVTRWRFEPELGWCLTSLNLPD